MWSSSSVQFTPDFRTNSVKVIACRTWYLTNKTKHNALNRGLSKKPTNSSREPVFLAEKTHLLCIWTHLLSVISVNPGGGASCTWVGIIWMSNPPSNLSKIFTLYRSLSMNSTRATVQPVVLRNRAALALRSKLPRSVEMQTWLD